MFLKRQGSVIILCYLPISGPAEGRQCNLAAGATQMLDTQSSNLHVIEVSERVPSEAAGSRLDAIAVELFPDFSRARLQGWIKDGALLLEGRKVKPNTKVSGGEILVLKAQQQPQGEWVAEDIPLNVVYEDESIIVIDKPAGIVVHPAAGNLSGTLLNGLLHHYPELKNIPRGGIVHRLDKDTTGLMVVARTLTAQAALVEQLQSRSVSRLYEAVVHGVPKTPQGSVEANIGRHPQNRLKMAVVRNGKYAVTHYTRLNHSEYFAHLRLKLETGRTHQIRVHMAHMGYPLVGDQVYGKSVNRLVLRERLAYGEVNQFPRQALHAVRLGLLHPVSGEECEWHSPLPGDIVQLLQWVLSE